MRQIPNLFTLLNLIFGCLAIVAMMQNGITVQFQPEGGQFIDLPEKIWYASLFIGLAAIVDFFDGFVARLMGAGSEMGKQLDSLADVVSFGVAPAMIIYQFLRMSYAHQEDGINVSTWLLAPAFLIAAGAAWRLAKFNLDTKQQYSFSGVPTPAVGLLIASFPLIYWYMPIEFVIKTMLNKWFLYSLILLLVWLMVSNLPMLALKFRNSSLKTNMPQFLLLIIAVIAAIFLKWLAVPLVFAAYIVLSLVFKKR